MKMEKLKKKWKQTEDTTDADNEINTLGVPDIEEQIKIQMKW